MTQVDQTHGVTKRVGAYGYRGGSFFDKRDFNIGAALIKHPKGPPTTNARSPIWQSCRT
jgi:hypothetical protein